MNGVQAIRVALEIDLAGLQEVVTALPEIEGDIAQALDIISKMQGRLIVTGLGKSGHIARKLAATFSSTGTPAYFLHPSEASHGDLGMVHPNDVILALSWSGETNELSDVLGYAKRRAVPVIALTGTAGSTLARAADAAIVLPKVREACPHNLAPTTSTLLQMTFGDAMAVALLQMKGFTEESFHQFHPGGSLGASLKRIDEIMHRADEVPLVTADAPVIDTINALSAQGFGIVGVVEGKDLVGVVTDGDIRRYLAENAGQTMQSALHETPVSRVMTRDSITLRPDLMVGEALRILQTKRISAAIVVNRRRPVGLVTMLRLLNRGAA